MKTIKRAKIASIAISALALSLIFSGIGPVQAAGTRDILLKAHLASATGSVVVTGSSDVAVVKLTAVPFGTSFNGFDIIVRADPAVLTATRVIVGSALSGPIATTYCINGSGINCGLNDGPGVAHLAAHSLANGVNGTLFKVVYKALNGVGVFGTVGTTVTIPWFTIAENGVGIAPTRFTVLTSIYGTVPTAGLPTATIASNQTAITIKAGHSHNVTITTTGLNGLSSTITLTVITPLPAGQITAKFVSTGSPTVVSTDCGARPALQLTLTPILTGTFTVEVTATIHGSASTSVTPVAITVTGN